jgi:cytochrome c oxidase subunit 2
VGPALAQRSRTPRRASRTSVTVIGMTALVLLMGGCSSAEVAQFKRIGLPTAASDRAPDMESLWIGFWIAAAVVSFFVWGLILWSVFRYRRRSDDQVPIQTRYNMPIEVLYTIVPFIMIAVLFFFTVQKQDAILANVAHPDHQVLVVGEKWAWTFDYLDEKTLGGHTDVYDTGTIDDPATLWLPVNETVRFNLRSPDVIHSFWVPAFYFKMDVIPGRSNAFSLKPTRIGTYAGHCAELCGTYHSRMIFTLRVVTPQQFDRHLVQLKRAGQVGAPTGHLTQVAPGIAPATPKGA